MTDANKEHVLVTEYFHPDTASTGQLMTDLAVGLEECGLDMTVLTGQPNYHSGENEKQPHVSTHEGVQVKRIRAPQVRQSSIPRRLFNWGVFTVWMFVVMLLSRTEKEREVIFVSNPPFLPVAMWLACRIRVGTTPTSSTTSIPTNQSNSTISLKEASHTVSGIYSTGVPSSQRSTSSHSAP